MGFFDKLSKEIALNSEKKKTLKRHDATTERNRSYIDTLASRAKAGLDSGDYRSTAENFTKMLAMGVTERSRAYGRDRISDAKNHTQVEAFDFMTRAANKAGHEGTKRIKFDKK